MIDTLQKLLHYIHSEYKDYFYDICGRKLEKPIYIPNNIFSIHLIDIFIIDLRLECGVIEIIEAKFTQFTNLGYLQALEYKGDLLKTTYLYNGNTEDLKLNLDIMFGKIKEHIIELRENDSIIQQKVTLSKKKNRIFAEELEAIVNNADGNFYLYVDIDERLKNSKNPGYITKIENRTNFGFIIAITNHITNENYDFVCYFNGLNIKRKYSYNEKEKLFNDVEYAIKKYNKLMLMLENITKDLKRENYD